MRLIFRLIYGFLVAIGLLVLIGADLAVGLLAAIAILFFTLMGVSRSAQKASLSRQR